MSPTATSSFSASPTESGTATGTPTDSPTATETRSASPSPTATGTATFTATPSSTGTATASPTDTATASPTATNTPLAVVTQNIPTGVTYTVQVDIAGTGLTRTASIYPPPDAFGSAVDLTVTVYGPGSAPDPTAGGFELLGNVYSIDDGGNSFNAGKTATLEFPYDPSQLPSGTTAQDLQVTYFDGSSWVGVSCTVDTADELVIATVTHFSLWSLAVEAGGGHGQPGFAGSGLGRALLAPVPVAAGQPLCLYFDTQPSSSQVELYNVAGELVSSGTFGATGSACLDTTHLASGIYLARIVVHDASGGTRTSFQKVAVLK